ncbi:T9SS type A sorting domain-containing protein [Flavobacteriales bacterium]|nr:T9SS type A sorting domain-containing protein [Flavobacteriales bacterium]
MKKNITFLAGIIISAGLFAQVNSSQSYTKNLLKAVNDKVTMSGEEVLSHLMVNPNPTTSPNAKFSSANEVVIGTTTYDLQSNAAVQNRIVHHYDGTISAGWTTSQELNASWSDRGTGYNFFDGTNWGMQPLNRLENSRGGWPSIIAMGSGKEASLTHNTDNAHINMTHRSTIGTGSWTEQNISSLNDSTGIYRDMIWNRSAVGGLNKETIHMIAVTASSNFAGVPFNGLDGALVYYRSQDEGVTWDIQDMQLPGMDTSMFTGMSGDVYTVTAQGETVVVAYFNDWGDSFIVKSIDNGTTWEKTTFLDFPIDKYAMDDGLDLDGDSIYDQVYSTDNYGAVILDANGEAHVFYGIMMYLDDDLTDASSSWFPGINGIAYWNESMGEDVTPATVHAGDTSLWYSDMMNDNWIVQAPDLNGDGIVGGVDSTGGYALYYASRASMPNAGISANGEIYLSFSGYTETADNGSQVYRHLYITKSSDGGSTWKTPVDVTPNVSWIGMKECVFGSMVPTVDDKIRIVFQMDNEPGLIVRGDEDLVDFNDIVYIEIDTVGLFGTSVSVNDIKNTTQFTVYPNPANDYTSIAISLDKTEKVILTIVDLLGKEISKEEKVLFSGKTTERLDVSNFQNGVYFINLQVGNKITTQKLVITK